MLMSFIAKILPSFCIQGGPDFRHWYKITLSLTFAIQIEFQDRNIARSHWLPAQCVHAIRWHWIIHNLMRSCAMQYGAR